MANLRTGHTASPSLSEADVLGVKGTTSRAFQLRPVTRLSGNFSIAKAQRAGQGVFEVKVFSIRCIRGYCSGFADRESTEGRIHPQGYRSMRSVGRVRVMDQKGSYCRTHDPCRGECKAQ